MVQTQDFASVQSERMAPVRPQIRLPVVSTGNRAPPFPPFESLAVYAVRLEGFICDLLTNIRQKKKTSGR